MNCHECDHATRTVGPADLGVSWCPRCGTLHTEGAEIRRAEAPMIVDRVRDGIRDGKWRWSGDDCWTIMAFELWRRIREAVGYSGSY